jgi:adenine-specific DNA-methyltransferase
MKGQPSRVEFLGNKFQLLDFILGAIEREVGEPTAIADLFCGTASVSRALRERGYTVAANDHLGLCTTLAEAVLLNDGTPRFEGILGDIDPSGEEPYDAVLAHLNQLPPTEGFIFRTYSPASEANCGTNRMYFTEVNAGRIDSIRAQLAAWEARLARGERALLLADLIRAVTAVSNTAGTYGCYLKYWKPRARLPLTLTRTDDLPRGAPKHSVTCYDADVAATALDVPVVYADPPYTKRQYAAYYHLLETIVHNDEPTVTGTTGLRPWEGKSSDFCYRRLAPEALRRLVGKLRCRHFFLSYNEDGQMEHQVIIDILKEFGEVNVVERAYRRYRSNAASRKGLVLTERLYHLAFS